MASALSYPASTAGLAWAVGGRPELGAAIGLAYAAALTWARLPPTVPPPPKGAGIVISGASSGIACAEGTSRPVSCSWADRRTLR